MCKPAGAVIAPGVGDRPLALTSGSWHTPLVLSTSHPLLGLWKNSEGTAPMSCGRIGLLRRKLLSASTVLGSQRTTTMSVRWSSCLTSRRKIPGWLGLRTRFESKQSPLIRPKQKVVVDLRLVTNFPSASPPHDTAGTVSTFGDLTSNFTAKMSPILTEWLSDWIQPNARWIMLLWTSAAWVAWRRAQQFNFSFNSYHMLFPSTSKPRSFVSPVSSQSFCE